MKSLTLLTLLICLSLNSYANDKSCYTIDGEYNFEIKVLDVIHPEVSDVEVEFTKEGITRIVRHIPYIKGFVFAIVGFKRFNGVALQFKNRKEIEGKVQFFDEDNPAPNHITLNDGEPFKCESF